MAEEPTVADSTTLLLVTAARQLSKRLDEVLSAHGLTVRHLGALGHLSRRPDLSYSDLARRAGVTSQSMHATVRALEEQGAVRRVLAGHGHAARLEVTEAGRELLAAVGRSVARLDAEVLGHLDADALAGLRAGLATLLVPTQPPVA